MEPWGLQSIGSQRVGHDRSNLIHNTSVLKGLVEGGVKLSEHRRVNQDIQTWVEGGPV